jgi:ketose-bisphosphate aldolase
VPSEPMKVMLDRAAAGGYAVGYFESWNLESLLGVVDAAEETGSPVVLGFNGDFISRGNRSVPERISWYAAMGQATAESASVPCALLLNECSKGTWIKEAVDLGFNGVMPVQSAGDCDAYIRFAREIADYAHPQGVAVEVELGELPCAIPSAAVHIGRSSMTDPDQAARLVEKSGADALAVSVGNVHIDVSGTGGRGLDLALLDRIRRAVSVPLVLHGGTGISPGDLKAAVERGVAKVNYGTYIKQRWLAAVRRAIGVDCEDPHRLLGLGGDEDLMVVGRRAVKQAVLERIGLLGCGGKA